MAGPDNRGIGEQESAAQQREQPPAPQGGQPSAPRGRPPAVDRNPPILESLVKTVDTAVNQVGQTAQQALGPQGPLSRTLDQVVPA
jgi:hypothetical protein